MKQRTIVITAIVILSVFVLSAVIPGIYSLVMAESDQDIINNAKQKQQEAQQNLDQTNQQKDQVLGVKKELDVKINGIQAEVDALDSQIADTEYEINNLNREIESAQQRIEVQDDLFRKRLRVMYENGSLGMLDVLVNAKSFSDLLYRIEAVQTIAQYDSDLLQKFEQDKQEVVDKKAVVDQKKSELEGAKAQQVTKRNELQTEIDKSQQEIDRLTADADSLKRAIEEYERAAEQANQRIQQKLKEAEEAAKRQQSQGSGGASAPLNFSGGPLSWPFASNYPLTDSFVNRISPITGKPEKHTGLDIGAPYGTTVLAAADGVVLISEFNTGGYGNYVVINHGGGVSTLYGHHSVNLVSAGTSVKKGDPIARVGSTGYSTGPHLHFEVRINGVPQNPLNYL